MLTIAANIRSVDANRSAPPVTPQPAAATAAPAQRSLPSAAAGPATRSADLRVRHVLKHATFHTDTLSHSPASAEGSKPYLEVPLLEGESKAPARE
eukprot:3007504-Prymnesium_polylepis.1